MIFEPFIPCTVPSVAAALKKPTWMTKKREPSILTSGHEALSKQAALQIDRRNGLWQTTVTSNIFKSKKVNYIMKTYDEESRICLDIEELAEIGCSAQVVKTIQCYHVGLAVMESLSTQAGPPSGKCREGCPKLHLYQPHLAYFTRQDKLSYMCHNFIHRILSKATHAAAAGVTVPYI